MRFFVYLSFVFLSVVCLQCKSEGSSLETTKTPTGHWPAAPAAPALAATQYPSVTEAIMKNLYDNCDYIDFVFYNTNFSMSQNQQAAIRSTLGTVSTTPATVLANCQPIGRLFFQIDGKNAEEADLFYGGDCLYYLFFKDGKYAYGNQLTEGGLTFYQKIFANVSTQGQ